ncbi:MAG: 4-(cytidine 5'-diphospho)-2-C-methyl-D-erythritol kinase [Casimicrobium sp.]
MKLTLPAPAKINTFLHIVGRRDDGYHLLESVMVFVSLADTVELTLRDDGVVRLLDPPPGITEANDLACRAARALQKETATKFGVDIRLTKRIPQGAGLGGGSSDAATTLLGLNRLWNLSLTREQLMQIGLALGADVPFFVFGRAAFMSGIGETLRTMHVPRATLVLAHPRVGVATAEAFAHPNLERNTAKLQIAQFNWMFGKNNIQSASEAIELNALKLFGEMRSSSLDARMTGSGSAYFARTRDFSTASRAATVLRKKGYSAWAVHSSERHPLHDFAKIAII